MIYGFFVFHISSSLCMGDKLLGEDGSKGFCQDVDLSLSAKKGFG